MTEYYKSPYSMGISFAFVRSLCILTGDESLNEPLPASDTILRRKLKEISAKFGIGVKWFTDSSFPREINQIANELVSKGMINEHEFLVTTDDFLRTHSDYNELPEPLESMRKPLL